MSQTRVWGWGKHPGCSDWSLCVQSLKAPELKEKLQESEKLIQEMTVTWEEKLRKTEEIATVGHQYRQAENSRFS